MSNKPIFVATHPRACSTAFERVFMTRRDTLHCVHEPFGDPFYFGPERLSERFADDEDARLKSGFSDLTYKDVVDGLQKDADENKDKRVFIKDLIYYVFPPDGKPAETAPSLQAYNPVVSNGTTNGTSSSQNPTVLPTSLLRTFHFTFLIRHPRRAIPSFYRCTVPPLDKLTGFYHFLPSEAGYDELRRFFDFLKDEGIVGSNGDGHGVKITVVDADDLLNHPAEVIEKYCNDVGIEYTPAMLKWGDAECQKRAEGAFEKWKGFHEDALGSTELKPRVGGAKSLSVEEENTQWREKFGEKAQKVIRECVDANVADYEYLKQFAMKV